MRRFGTAMVCVAFVLAGCGVLDREPSPEIPTGCGQCEAEIADLVAELEGLPDVVEVSSTRRTTTGVPAAYLRIGIDLKGKDIVSTDVGAIVDEVAEVAWKSGVDPLDVLNLDVSLGNGYREGDGFFFGADRDLYEERWGPRPDGSVWTPVSEDPRDGAEGCSADSCRDLMRGIARDVSALPGVTAVTRSEFIPDTPTNGWATDVTVETDGTDVLEDVAEIVWRSRVRPLEWIGVTAAGPDGDPDHANFWVDPDDGKDYDRFVTMWGERP